MITKIRIVGIGEHRSGVDKNKREYSFTPVFYTRPDKYVNGLVAESANLDDETFAHCPLVIGKEYRAVTHQANFRTYVDAVLEEC